MTEPMNRYGRVGEIFYALIDVAPTDETKQMLSDFAGGVFEDQREEEASSLEAEVVRAIVDCLGQAKGDLLLIKSVAQKINQDRDDKDRIRPQRIGRTLARLGFKKARMPDSKGSYAIVIDSDLIHRLAATYDIKGTETLDAHMPPKSCSDAQLLRGHAEETTLSSEHSEQLSRKEGHDKVDDDLPPHDLVLHAADKLTRKNEQATISDLEVELSGKVSGNDVYHWMDVLVKEGLVQQLDWGKWRTLRA